MATMSFRQEELEMLHKCLLLARHTALTRYKKEKMSLDDYVRLDTQIGILIDRIWDELVLEVSEDQLEMGFDPYEGGYTYDC